MEDLLVDLVDASKPSIIKVIGVGGGGDNAVAHMYREGNICDVNYLVCNTDSKALETSPVPTQLQLGSDGLGAGGDPTKGKTLAEESVDKIRSYLNNDIKMVFVTAGMGGGTGTGAAPVIARESKKQGILTIGIVTIPFRFEGNRKIDKALDGVEELAENVDAILVINNERLREIYQDFPVTEAFKKADDTLTIAVRSIVDIITMHGTMILDFRDVYTTLHDGGVAIMSTGYAKGENRVAKAIQDALNSPLINNRDIFKSKKILISISTSTTSPLIVYEMNDINAFMENFEDRYIETKYGISTDDNLGEQVKITILASGFGLSDFREKKDNVVVFTADDINKVLRRDHVYGKTEGGKTVIPHRIFLFETEDLDDEEKLYLVESTPTYKREKVMLDQIMNNKNGELVAKEKNSATS